jgi:hypothetical protein
MCRYWQVRAILTWANEPVTIWRHPAARQSLPDILSYFDQCRRFRFPHNIKLNVIETVIIGMALHKRVSQQKGFIPFVWIASEKCTRLERFARIDRGPCSMFHKFPLTFGTIWVGNRRKFEGQEGRKYAEVMPLAFSLSSSSLKSFHHSLLFTANPSRYNACSGDTVSTK